MNTKSVSRRMCQKNGTMVEVADLRLLRDEDVGISRCAAVVVGRGHPVGLGGTRLARWPDDAKMVEDLVLLGHGMEAKSRFHKLPYSGAKVTLELRPGADPEAAFERVGRLVAGFEGRLVTTEDLGTNEQMMGWMSRTAPRLVMGRPETDGGSGDPSPYTAEGVVESIRATARVVLGRSDLDGLRVFVKGLGHVGCLVAERLLAEGVRVAVTDTDQSRLARFRDRPGVAVVEPAIGVVDLFCPPPAQVPPGTEIFCPCACGGDITEGFAAPGLKAIVGAANNQLTSFEAAWTLHQSGVIYCPDYVANGGGLISVAAEHMARSRGWALDHAREIGDVVADLLHAAERRNLPPLAVADEIIFPASGARNPVNLSTGDAWLQVPAAES